MELLVGMIISAIVIAFGYASYELINKQFLNYKTVKVKLMEAEQLRSALTLDIRGAERISFNENKLSLFRKDSLLEYRFLDNLIVRKEREVSDTFRIPAANLRCRFLLPDEKMFVTRFSFTTTVLKEDASFCIMKSYSSELLMNYAPVIKAND